MSVSVEGQMFPGQEFLSCWLDLTQLRSHFDWGPRERAVMVLAVLVVVMLMARPGQEGQAEGCWFSRKCFGLEIHWAWRLKVDHQRDCC